MTLALDKMEEFYQVYADDRNIPGNESGARRMGKDLQPDQTASFIGHPHTKRVYSVQLPIALAPSVSYVLNLYNDCLTSHIKVDILFTYVQYIPIFWDILQCK